MLYQELQNFRDNKKDVMPFLKKHTPKNIQKDNLSPNKEIVYEFEETKIFCKENKLPVFETINDFLHFASQVIDNNEEYHLDLLLTYLPKFNTLIDKNNVANLEPVLLHTFNLSTRFPSGVKSLEAELAYYLNDFGEILLEKYPAQLANLKKVKHEIIKKYKSKNFYTKLYKHYIKELEKQLAPIERRTISKYTHQIYRTLFIKSKSLIKQNRTLGLLSTPTHAPCWIHPKVFLDRLISYEESKTEFNLYDFQIAIGRLPIIDRPKKYLIAHIEQLSNNEIKEILQYHFGILAIQSTTISQPELWLQSVLSRNIDSEIAYFKKQINSSLSKETGNYSTAKAHTKTGKSIKLNSIYQYNHIQREQSYDNEAKFLFLSPNNPSAFLHYFSHNHLRTSTLSYENDKKQTIHLLKALNQIWYKSNYSQPTYLFLAKCLLCSYKVARELAAEIWINAHTENNMNNVLLGQILGKLQVNEYAPHKRFTDLISAYLFHISTSHNQALLSLLDAMLSQMNEVPQKNLKKLLVLFSDLKRSCPGQEISGVIKEKLKNRNKKLYHYNTTGNKLSKSYTITWPT